MEELNESKTAEVLESEASVEEFEIKEVSLADTTEAPKEKKAIDWLKVGVAGTLACSVLSMGLSCAALIKRTNDASNQGNQSSSNVNDSSSVTISEDGYFVIDGTKTNIKADGSSSEIVDAQIVPTDKWGISTYMMFTFSDGSYVTTQPKVQVLNDHYYDAASVSDLEILTATYAAPKVRLTSNINVTSALEFGSSVEINLNNKTFTYAASAPIEVADEASVKFANGSITFNTAKAMVLGEGSSLEIADATVSAQGTVAEVAGDDAKVEITKSAITSTGKVVDIANNANNFEFNADEATLNTADAGNKFVSTQADLDAAIADANVTSITLTTNVTLTSTLNISKDLTVDLNGKTITSPVRAFNILDGEVSIDNGTINVAGDHSLYVNGTATGSDITLTLGEDLVVNSDNCAIFIKGAGAKLVTAATLTATGQFATLSGNGNAGNEVDSITIIGGSITHASTMAIYVPQTGEFNITGGSITGTTALYVKSGIVNISGGTFTATGDYTGYVYSGDGAKFFGDAFIIDACGYPGGNPVVTITGGTFTAQDADGHGIAYYAYAGNTATITAEGYDIYKTSCVATTADFTAALADTSVSHITLAANVTLTSTLNISKDVTVDLNGKTITSPVRAFNILDGEISIDNGTINVAGDHSLYINGTATGSDITLNLGADLVVNSDNCAIFIKGAGAKLVTAATLTSTGPYATLSGNGNKGNEVDSITITGGSITHATYAAIYVPQTGEFNITGGTITGTAALYVKSGIVNISGGTFTGTGEYTGYVYSQDGAKFFGDALIIDACDYPGGNPVVTITGGTFTSTNAHGIGYYAFEDNTATITAAGYDIYKTTCVSTEAALVSAIADTTVSVVTLTKNITLANTVNIARDVVINLNGKTVTSSTKAFNIVDGEVSIDNGTITVAGHHSLYVDGTATGSDITLTLGEDLVVNSDNCAIFIKGAGAKLVTAATLTSTGPYATLSGNGNAGNEVDSITIIGGSITHASTMAIYVPQTGEFNITGGTITGTTALYVKSGIVNISGGTFTGTGEYTGYVYSGDGAKFFGDALIIDACGYPGGNPVVTITGGTFTTTDTDAHGIGYYTYGQNTATISAEGYEVYTENN